MLDLAIGGVSIAVLLGVIYWIHTSFVSEKTCKARGDCVEGSLNSLKELMETKFNHITELINKLIEKHN